MPIVFENDLQVFISFVVYTYLIFPVLTADNFSFKYLSLKESDTYEN